MAEPNPSDQPGWDVRDDIAAFYRALTPEQVMEGIAKAIKACDFEAVATLLGMLAVKDPHQAEVVYESMLAVIERAAPRAGKPGGPLPAAGSGS